MAAVSDVDRLTTLFKRAQGFTNLNTNYALNQETVVSRPAVMADRVFTGTVPAIPPSDLGDSTDVIGGGTKQTSGEYSYLAKYSNVPLISQAENPNKTFSTNANGVNLLTNILLPRVSDATLLNNTYAILVEGSYPISQANYILDRDAGRIMIFDAPVNNGSVSPTMSFWRYEGATLADGGGGGGAVNSVTAGSSGNLVVNPTTGSVVVDLSDKLTLSGTPLILLSVGDNGESGATIRYSYDGLTWYGDATNTFSSSGRGVAFGGDMWVAVGIDSVGKTIKYSTDGKTWFDTVNPFTSAGYGVAYGNGRWIAVGANIGGGDTIKISDDGITWTNKTGHSVATNGVAYNSDPNSPTWVAVGTSSGGGGTPIKYSIDNGLTWQETTNGFPDVGYAVTYNDSTWIAVGNASGGGYLGSYNSILWSIDGIEWFSSNLDFPTNGRCIAYNGNGTWLAGGDGTDGNTILKSTDAGINWSPSDTGASASSIYGITYSNGTWFAVGYAGGGTTTGWYSTNNGDFWQPMLSGTFSVRGYGIIQLYSTQPNITFQTGFTSYIRTVGGGDLYLGTGSTNTVKVDASGKVGIGMSTPLTTVDINGSTRITKAGTLSEAGYDINTTSDTLVLDTGVPSYNNSVGSILFKTNDSNKSIGRIAAINKSVAGSVHTDSDLVLQTGYDVNTIDRLRLSNNSSTPSSLGTNLMVGSGNNIGDASDNTTYGLERSRNVIQFPAYRDVTLRRVGAKIAGINKQTFTTSGTNKSLIQSTDLAFYTVPPNTGNSSDDTIERMRITDSGNVGIGTSSPQLKLDVAGTYRFITDDQVFPIQNGSSDQLYLQAPSGRIRLGGWSTNGSIPLTLNESGGNVGIGTTAPNAKLDVAGDMRIGNSDTLNQMRFYGTTNDTPGGYSHTVIAERVYGNVEQSELLLFKGNDPYGPAGPDRVRILSAGGFVVDITESGVTWDTTATNPPTARIANALVVNADGNTSISGNLTVGGSITYGVQQV